MAGRGERHGGFTLIELIIVIVISGILATMIASFITGPIHGAVEQDARAALVDQADLAVRRMARAIHVAVPNSARVAPAADPTRLEIIATLEGAGYRADPGEGASGEAHRQPSDRLNTNTADASFNILGRFNNPALQPGSTLTDGQRMTIYPTDADTLYSDAASNDPNEGVITPASTGSGFQIQIVDDVDESQINFSNAFEFTYASPRQRLYVTEEPVSFVCAGGRLLMYRGYAIQAGQPDQAALEGGLNATRGVLARNVTDCSFTYDPGTPQRAGLVTVDIELSTARAGVVRLLQQVHVVNTP